MWDTHVAETGSVVVGDVGSAVSTRRSQLIDGDVGVELPGRRVQSAIGMPSYYTRKA